MVLVVLLKGVNVGGHRRLRPSALARSLRHFDVVSVGAAGTFIVRERVGRAELRAAIARRLPFEAELMICSGRDVLDLVSRNPFEGHAVEPDVVQFVSAMVRSRTPPSPLPPVLPAEGEWCLRVLARHGRFILGLHRREMKAITYLGRLETAVGVPLTTRSWKTVVTVARYLGGVG